MRRTYWLTYWLITCLTSWSLVAADIEGPYFSPNGGCADAIIRNIDAAKKEILVQAYGFTYGPVGDALLRAKKRGVKVVCVLDRSNETARKSLAPMLRKAGVPVWIDYKPAIAHMKVFIFDRSHVSTGSYNPSVNGERSNVENLIIVWNDKAFVDAYVKQFETRRKLSRTYKP